MKRTMMFCLMIASMLLTTQNIEALKTTIGAEIYGNETYSEFGHVLNYRKTGKEKLKRKHNITATSFLQSEPIVNEITSLSPNDDIQTIDPGSLYFTLEYNNQVSTFQKVNDDKKLEVKFYVTQNGFDFIDATNSLEYDNSSKQYNYDGTLKGYKISIIKKTGKYIEQKVGLFINHDISLEYDNMSEGQKNGTEKLVSWLDSKFFNEEPEGNQQNIYVIQPEISGKVKYQGLTNKLQTPDWDIATKISDIQVNLYEKQDHEYIKISETKTNNDGVFKFSNYEVDGEKYFLNNTSNNLYYDIDHPGFEMWSIEKNNINVVNRLDEKINIGRITDISRYQSKFNVALQNTKWNNGFKQLDVTDDNAIGMMFIITDYAERKKEKGEVEVFYKDTQGNILAKTEKMSGIIGSEYKTTQKNIAGSTFIEVRGQQNGVYSKNKQLVTYIYKKESKLNYKRGELPKTGNNLFIVNFFSILIVMILLLVRYFLIKVSIKY